VTRHDIARTERAEIYLKAVYTVLQTASPATVSKVAEFMGVSAPSASETLRRLAQQGYVSGGGEEGYRLTASGWSKATRIVRRLRLAERLLTDVLKLDLPKVYDEACKMEHVISDEVEDALAKVLGQPRTCPHGLPIPGAPEQAVPSTSLADFGAGQSGRVAVVPEEDTAMLAYLSSLGLVPGVRVTVYEVAPFNGPVSLQLDGSRHAIGRDVAARVRVVLST
jgi:DtxR family Mn-dependent transcriptional regulator